MDAKRSALLVVALGAAVGLGYYLGANRVVPAAVDKDDTLRDQITRLRTEIRDLDAEVRRLRSSPGVPVAAGSEPAVREAAPYVMLTPGVPPLVEGLKPPSTQVFNSVRNNLRQMRAASAQFRLENGRDPTYDELVGEGKFIRAMRQVDSENYSAVSLAANAPMTVTTAAGLQIMLEPQGAPAPQAPLGAAQADATTAFRAAAGGRSPVGFELANYFDDPELRSEYVAATQMIELQMAMGAGFAQTAGDATRAYTSAYRAAHGAEPPQTFQTLRYIAPYITNATDQQRFVEAWEKINQAVAAK